MPPRATSVALFYSGAVMIILDDAVFDETEENAILIRIGRAMSAMETVEQQSIETIIRKGREFSVVVRPGNGFLMIETMLTDES